MDLPLRLSQFKRSYGELSKKPTLNYQHPMVTLSLRLQQERLMWCVHNGDSGREFWRPFREDQTLGQLDSLFQELGLNALEACLLASEFAARFTVEEDRMKHKHLLEEKRRNRKLKKARKKAGLKNQRNMPTHWRF